MVNGKGPFRCTPACLSTEGLWPAELVIFPTWLGTIGWELEFFALVVLEPPFLGDLPPVTDSRVDCSFPRPLRVVAVSPLDREVLPFF